MGHLNQLHEKYFDQGLRVIGLGSDSSSQVQSVFVEELGAKYWIALDSGREALGAFGGGGIPHVYLVDATGRIVGDGHPNEFSEEKIEELLKQAFVPELGRELHRSLKSAVKSYESGKVGAAWTAASRQLEAEDRVLAADAKFLRDKCEEYAGFKKASLEGQIAAKAYSEAYDAIKAIQKEFAGMEVATFAADTKKKLDADKQVKVEMKAWKAYLKALAKEQDAGRSQKKLADARKAYEKVFKKYPGTRAADMANKATRRLPPG